MIEVQGLTKRYGDKVAVDGLSFTVEPGRVTGFLGPNGAGKSTTMRLILGLDAPTHGSATVNGRSYRQHPAPLREVGALLEARSVHPGRSAYHHLLAIVETAGIARSRVTRSSTWSASVRWCAGGPAASRSAWASASASPPPCSAIPAR
jgi:ABC-2 type transport system ATP-binding protein